MAQLRIWYVIGIVEYWLVPDYKVNNRGTFSVEGCRLYTGDMKYKGYWHFVHMPLDVKRLIRQEVSMYEGHLMAERKRKVWLAGRRKS